MRRIKFLIIDDEDIVLKSTIKILKNENFDIDTASNAEEGLKKIEQNEYDIVISDLVMPGISGLEVLKFIREKKPDITVIIFTGYATVETAREALKNGAFDYIPKPFTPEEFREVVSNAVRYRENKASKMIDLMAIVSHELQSPTSVIHTNADTLYKGYFGNLQPEQQKIIEAIIRNCSYLEDIIRNYLDLSKMEMDDIVSFKEKINLVDDVIHPVVEIPEHENNFRKMPIVENYMVKPQIYGDPNLLQIVITNLINNSIKYGKPGTEIRIDLTEEKDAYKITVFNEGVGIPKEDAERLFRKFGRLKQKGTEGIKGSGLGLYMCKKIIDKHNGRICVDSEVGKFVAVSILLPR